MSFNVGNIKGILNQSNGVSQPCYYVCNILPPAAFYNGNFLNSIGSNIAGNLLASILRPVMASGISNIAKQVSFLAEAASIPGRQLLTTDHKIFGTLRKMPYGVQYEDMTITFICTNLMVERAFFDVWHQFIISPSSQYMEYYNSYVGQIVIQKVSNDGQDGVLDSVSGIMATYTLEEAYPVSIQAQELSYSDGDYLKLTVQFAYARWKCTLDKLFPGEQDFDRLNV